MNQQMPYSYMPSTMMPNMPTEMMSMQSQKYDTVKELEAKLNRLERQVKRLEHRISNLENPNIMPLSSNSKGYGNTDTGMYMM